MTDKEYNFYGMLSRMKYINRWGLMRNTINENIAEHSLDVAIIAHALGVISNVYFNGDIDESKLTMLALYHDTSEIITGDMPTPIKYYAPEIQNAYKEIEYKATEQLLSELPEEMREHYANILHVESNDEKYCKLVKAADKFSALIKCMEEISMGNHDFDTAKDTLLSYIKGMNLKEADFFLDKFIPAYNKTLDEQSSLSK